MLELYHFVVLAAAAGSALLCDNVNVSPFDFGLKLTLYIQILRWRMMDGLFLPASNRNLWVCDCHCKVLRFRISNFNILWAENVILVKIQ